MKRREFVKLLGSAVATWPLAALAQPGERMRRIGVLMGYAEGDPETKTRLMAFRAGLAKRGWSDGGNIRIDYRFAAGKTDQYTSLAKELLSLQPDVVLAHTTASTAALQQESRAIPIVFANVSDPIGSGFVSSLARPGGNITGVLHYEPGIFGKQLALLKEIAPNLAYAVLLANRKTTPFDYFKRSLEASAASLAIELVPTHVETAADIERAVEVASRKPNAGLILPPDATTVAHRDLIIALAARYRLPAVYPFGFFVEAGGLLSYGTDQLEIFRLAAFYIDRTLRGDKPTELPVQAPTKFETTVNLKTAKTLGLSVPPRLLVAADEVIE
jgi:putative tryptophan/tyrosine transport system substrate-binding protein